MDRGKGKGHYAEKSSGSMSGIVSGMEFAGSMSSMNSMNSMNYPQSPAKEDFHQVYPPSSKNSINNGKLLQNMSLQNGFAARTIQRIWRAHSTRCLLWSWGGILLVSRAVKIQRVWRGRRGRQIALDKAIFRLCNFANLIKGQYFIWKAKKRIRILQAENIERNVVMIQCLYRTRLARSAMGRARFMHHTIMATRIESLVRGNLGRRRYKGVKSRLRDVFQRMTSTIKQDIKLAQLRVKPTLENLVGSTDRSSSWEIIETLLFQLLGTYRRDIAVDLASDLSMKHPNFQFGRFALQIALFLTWTCSGSTQHVRIDLLDELIGCLYYNQNVIGTEKDFNDVHYCNKHRSPESLECDPTSQFGWEDELSGSMDEFEFMYFRNAFMRHGKNALSLSAMAACALMKTQIVDFDSDRTVAQQRSITRAKSLLQIAKGLSSNNAAEADSRLEFVENVFSKPHRVMLYKMITFNGLKMLGYKAFTSLHSIHQKQLKDDVELDVEVVKCGECVILRATLKSLPICMSKLKKLRAQNEIPKIHRDVVTGEALGIDMVPKWATSTKEYTEIVCEIADKNDGLGSDMNTPSLTPNHSGSYLSGSGRSGSHHEEHSDPAEKLKKKKIEPIAPEYNIPLVTIRPMILMEREVALLSDLAVTWIAESKKMEEDEVRAEGMNKVLAEYLLKNVRVVTCRSRLVTSDTSAEMISLKVSLPQIEYRRLEQNNARTVDYSIKLIQRVYRGSLGKHRFRRMWFRSKEKARQLQLISDNRQAMADVRNHRFVLVSKIQACVRVWSWRRLIRKMKKCAIIVQCRFRCYRAKIFVAEEKRRRALGPEVHEMLRRGVKIGTLSFTVIVYRCGYNYRLKGYDLIQNKVYEGNVFKAEIEKMLEVYNSKLTGETQLMIEKQKVKPWNYHKVSELIIAELGLAQAMPNVTTNLGGTTEATPDFVLILKPGITHTTPGVSKIKHLGRTLKDTAFVVEKYNKILDKQKRLKLMQEQLQIGTAKSLW